MLVVSPKSDMHGLWKLIVKTVDLSGLTRVLLENCTLSEVSNNCLLLSLKKEHAPLLNPKHVERIQSALSKCLKIDITVVIAVDDQNDL